MIPCARMLLHKSDVQVLQAPTVSRMIMDNSLAFSMTLACVHFLILLRANSEEKKSVLV